jgi:hypothetical protein
MAVEGAPAGGTWSRKWFEAYLAERADTQVARGRKQRPRPTAGTVGCCESCCGMASCRRRGSRRRSCWSGANGPGCRRHRSINARPGAADPHRAVSARADVAGDLDPLGQDPGAARRRRAGDRPGGPATGAHGVDVTVDQSDCRRAGGFLSRQGPDALNSPVEVGGRHRPPTHHGSSRVSSRNRRARQHPCWTALGH